MSKLLGRLEKWSSENSETISIGLKLSAGLAVVSLISDTFAVGELETQVNKATNLVTGPVAKFLTGGAVIGGGVTAVFKGQLFLGLAIIGTLVLVSLGMSLVDSGIKVW